jgi:hypothetical protein
MAIRAVLYKLILERKLSWMPVCAFFGTWEWVVLLLS